MRRVGQARKRDRNEKPIVDAMEKLGATVLRLSGKGCPDLLVGLRGFWLPVEVKWPGRPLTTAQMELRTHEWFPVVETPDEAQVLVSDMVELARRVRIIS